MDQKLSHFLLKQKITITLHKIVYPLVFVVSLILLAAQVYLTLQTYTTFEEESAKRDLLAQSYQSILSSKPVDDTQLTLYSKIFAILMPQEESIFSLNTAMELLASQTEMTIESFSPSVSDVGASKTSRDLAVDVTLSGSKFAFDRFIHMYQFASQRYITISSIDMDASGDRVNVKLTLKFYTQPFIRDKSALLEFTQEHKKQFDQVKKEINTTEYVTVPSHQSPIDTTYETGSPF